MQSEVLKTRGLCEILTIPPLPPNPTASLHNYIRSHSQSNSVNSGNSESLSLHHGLFQRCKFQQRAVKTSFSDRQYLSSGFTVLVDSHPDMRSEEMGPGSRFNKYHGCSCLDLDFCKFNQNLLKLPDYNSIVTNINIISIELMLNRL